MNNFTPAERVEVDRQYRILAKALHALDPASAKPLWTAAAVGLPSAPVGGEGSGPAALLVPHPQEIY